METEVSLPYSQEPATNPYPEPDASSLHLTSPRCFPKIHSNIIFSFMPRSSEWLLPSGFPTKILYAFLTFPCILHVSLISLCLVW